jgi:hypothetical protein
LEACLPSHTLAKGPSHLPTWRPSYHPILFLRGMILQSINRRFFFKFPECPYIYIFFILIYKKKMLQEVLKTIGGYSLSMVMPVLA